MAFSNLSSNSAVFAERAVPLAALLTGVLVVVVGGWFMVYPLVERLLPGSELDRAVQDQVLAERKEYLNGLNVLANLIKTEEAGTGATLSAVVPADTSVPTLFASYEKMVKNQGSEIGVMDVSVPEKSIAQKNGSGTVITSLKLTAVRYEALKNFIKEVETFQRLSDVTTFGYDSKDGFATVSITNYFDK